MINQAYFEKKTIGDEEKAFYNIECENSYHK